MDVGMIGLGVMGRNLALNMADHGFGVVGFDRDALQIAALRNLAGDRPVCGAASLTELVRQLPCPRTLFLLVPAGAPVDAAIRDVLPMLSPGDLVIDAGDSHYRDTDLRIQALQERGLDFLGVGISGGAAGARNGPSLMAGGSRDAYERVRGLFESIAANVNNEPCVAWCGSGSAGHYVKMVHDGVECGLLELIAEAYDLLHHGLQMTNEELQDVFDAWNRTELSSFLVEITARIFEREDAAGNRQLIDVILDEARQPRTEMWTSQEAMTLHVPVPTIDAAVAMRELFALKAERETASRLVGTTPWQHEAEHQAGPRELRNSLYAAAIMTYAQGLALLRQAAVTYKYELRLADVVRIWRGGCSIRAAVLEKIQSAFERWPGLANLLLDPVLVAEIQQRQDDLRLVVRQAACQGRPAPALMASLTFWDSYRSEWLPANLIQAQRDFFGAHTCERDDLR